MTEYIPNIAKVLLKELNMHCLPLSFVVCWSKTKCNSLYRSFKIIRNIVNILKKHCISAFFYYRIPNEKYGSAELVCMSELVCPMVITDCPQWFKV